MKNKIREFVLMNLGILLLAIGVYFFKIPNGFSTGGVSGLGTIFGEITSISPALWIIIINVFLLIVGFIFIGKKTSAKTVYCSLMYSILTWVFEIIIPLSEPISNQPLLELIYAILLTSVGSALMFFCDASSGGTDITALILKKYTNMDVGKALLCTDFVIAASAFLVFDVQAGLFSILGLMAKAFVVDIVIDNLNTCKYFLVITEKEKEITDYIMKTLHHGVTVSYAHGAYTNADKFMIHTVCKRIEAIILRKKIKEVDPHAFVIITTSSEIIGRGFRAV